MLNAPTDSTSFLMELQDVLDQMGLNTPAGVARLAQLSLDDAEMTALAEELARKTGMSVDAAKDQLREVSSCFTRSKSPATVFLTLPRLTFLDPQTKPPLHHHSGSRCSLTFKTR